MDTLVRTITLNGFVEVCKLHGLNSHALLSKVGLHAIRQGSKGEWAALGQQDADDDRRFLPTVQADGTRLRGHWPRGRNLSRFDLCECLSHATT